MNPSEKSHLKLLKSIAIFQNLNSDFPIEGIVSEKGPWHTTVFVTRNGS